MKTIIAGSRHFHEQAVIDQAVEDSGFVITRVISGAANGVDELGETWARKNGIRAQRFRANWKKHGRAAGPIRNGKMSRVGEALIALPCSHSRGTWNMIELARKQGLKVFVQEVQC